MNVGVLITNLKWPRLLRNIGFFKASRLGVTCCSCFEFQQNIDFDSWAFFGFVNKVSRCHGLSHIYWVVLWSKTPGHFVSHVCLKKVHLCPRLNAVLFNNFFIFGRVIWDFHITSYYFDRIVCVLVTFFTNEDTLRCLPWGIWISLVFNPGHIWGSLELERLGDYLNKV